MSTKIRATCGQCGRHSRYGRPSPSGRVDLFEIGIGWSVAPYPADYVHPWGAVGDIFTCPACCAKRVAS